MNNPVEKSCIDCKEVKNNDEYYKMGKYLDSRCKICHHKKAMDWYNQHKKHKKDGKTREDLRLECVKLYKEGLNKSQIKKTTGLSYKSVLKYVNVC